MANQKYLPSHNQKYLQADNQESSLAIQSMAKNMEIMAANYKQGFFGIQKVLGDLNTSSKITAVVASGTQLQSGLEKITADALATKISPDYNKKLENAVKKSSFGGKKSDNDNDIIKTGSFADMPNIPRKKSDMESSMYSGGSQLDVSTLRDLFSLMKEYLSLVNQERSKH